MIKHIVMWSVAGNNRAEKLEAANKIKVAFAVPERLKATHTLGKVHTVMCSITSRCIRPKHLHDLKYRCRC